MNDVSKTYMMLDEKLSPHFTLEELVFSDTAARLGIDNMPDANKIQQLIWLAARLENVRQLVGPMRITSGYRCLALNRAIRSKDTSQHIKCEAVDFVTSAKPFRVCKKIEESDLRFDQLIYEFGSWTHISFTQNPRGSVLTIDKHGARLGILEA